MSVPTTTVFQQGQGAAGADDLNSMVRGSTNVAQLRTFIGLDGMQVALTGFSTFGDGGQGVFGWVSTSTATDDDGVTAVVPNGVTQGAWLRLPYPTGATGETPASVAPPNSITPIGTNSSGVIDIPVLTGPTSRLFSVTTDGSGQPQVLNLPAYPLDTHSENIPMLDRRLTITLGTLTNSSDVVVITEQGNYDVSLLHVGAHPYRNSGFQRTRADSATGGVRLTQAGSVATFVWSQGGWRWDAATAQVATLYSNFESDTIFIGTAAAGPYAESSAATVYIYGGESTVGGDGGEINLKGGNSTGAIGGCITIVGGYGDSQGGNISMSAGGTATGVGAEILVTGCNSAYESYNGAITITSGRTGNATKSGGDITITASHNGNSTGGNVSIIASGGNIVVSGNHTHGYTEHAAYAIVFNSGRIGMPSLPTSAAGIVSGMLYNSSGTVKIKP